MAIFGMAARHVAPLLSLRYQKAYPPKRPTLLNQRIGRIVMCIQGKGLWQVRAGDIDTKHQFLSVITFIALKMPEICAWDSKTVPENAIYGYMGAGKENSFRIYARETKHTKQAHHIWAAEKSNFAHHALYCNKKGLSSRNWEKVEFQEPPDNPSVMPTLISPRSREAHRSNVHSVPTETAPGVLPCERGIPTHFSNT